MVQKEGRVTHGGDLGRFAFKILNAINNIILRFGGVGGDEVMYAIK